MASPHPILPGLPPAIRFEGHAIVSADGMIAAADGTMPPSLRNSTDFLLFQAALDASVLVVLGRLGHQRHRNPGRQRLVFTGSVAALEPDPADSRATFFNPAGLPLTEALATLGIADGVVAVTGGMLIFDYFLPLYDRFALVEANGFVLPGGIACFSGGHPRIMLAANGLLPLERTTIDAENAIDRTIWQRPATSSAR